MKALSLPLLLVFLVLAGCGGSAPGDGAEETAVPPGSTPVAASTIYSLAVDPGDGTMLLTVGPFTHRLAPGATAFEPIEPTMSADGGRGRSRTSWSASPGPAELLASGHALRPPLPRNLGLVSSADGGMTWASVSGLDEADYHEVEVTKDAVVGLRSDSRGVRVSRDGGRTFETREPPGDSPPIDAAIDPADPEHLAVSSAQGVFISTNGGASWRQRDTTSSARLVWLKPDALYSGGLDGKVRRSADGGRSWEETGTLGAGPKEFVAGPEGDLLAVLAGGDVRRSTDGGATWTAVAKLQ